MAVGSINEDARHNAFRHHRAAIRSRRDISRSATRRRVPARHLARAITLADADRALSGRREACKYGGIMAGHHDAGGARKFQHALLCREI